MKTQIRHFRLLPFVSDAFLRGYLDTSWSKEWQLVVLFGRGAGYIGGAKFYLGYGSLRRDGKPSHTCYAMGFTRNGNNGLLVTH